ncbi:eukaryotic membrane protein family-domain-containing protein [Catenaria anguillulae PL171]|uniref:Eukaryotic membrane protein family-domain-containing protein n=1 Tax=Catenaria anguillulae PL171 TaxID=765915 RepID=A0A1Y2HLX6_9FUNG|nr:eukaryotic membrane protein family-domain-containing protein [Catenaria anguillulae PL171]
MTAMTSTHPAGAVPAHGQPLGQPRVTADSPVEPAANSHADPLTLPQAATSTSSNQITVQLNTDAVLLVPVPVTVARDETTVTDRDAKAADLSLMGQADARDTPPSTMATPLPTRPATLSRSEPLLSTGTPLLVSTDSLAAVAQDPISSSVSTFSDAMSSSSSALSQTSPLNSADSPTILAPLDGGETATMSPPTLAAAPGPKITIPTPVTPVMPATPPLSPNTTQLNFEMLATPRPASAPPMVLPPPLPLPPAQYATYLAPASSPESPSGATFTMGSESIRNAPLSSPSPSPPQSPTPSSPKSILSTMGPVPARVTVSSYLSAALFGADLPQGAEQKTERVSNFLSVPYELEKTLWLGYIVCLDAFLTIFTILPLRVVIATVRGFRKLMYHQVTLERNHIMDVWKAIILVFSCAVLYQIDPSWLYHTIRGQSMMKLYVIFNLLEVCDRLCCSFGIDILDSLFARSLNEPHSKRTLPILLHFALAGIYVTIHSVVLYYQMVTLNVSINSNSNSLLPLLISNQFVEIKSSVFKRFESENLFQLTCADMTERMNLSVYLLLNVSRNFLELLNNTDGHMTLSFALPYLSWSTSASLDSMHLPTFLHTAWKNLNASLFNSSSTHVAANATATRLTLALTHDTCRLLDSISVSLDWWSYTGPAPAWLPVALDVLYPAMIVGLSEIVVDWLKHAFITKFNNLQPEQVYSRFRRVLCMDIVAATPASPDENAEDDEDDNEAAHAVPPIPKITRSLSKSGPDARGRPTLATRQSTLLAIPHPVVAGAASVAAGAAADDDTGLVSDTSTRTLTLTRSYPGRHHRAASRSRSITPRRSLNASPTPTSTPTRARAPVPATPSGLLRPTLGHVHSIATSASLPSSSSSAAGSSRDTSPSPPVSSSTPTRHPRSPTMRVAPRRRSRRASLHPTQDTLPHVSRRLGFGALPLAVVTIRMTLDNFEAAALTWGFAWLDPPGALRLVPGTAKRAGTWVAGWVRRAVGNVGVVALVQSVPVHPAWVEWVGTVGRTWGKVGVDVVDRFGVLVGAAGLFFIALLSLKVLLGVTLLDQCLYQRQRWMANGEVVEPIGEPGSKKKADKEKDKDKADGVKEGAAGGNKQEAVDKLAGIDRYTLVKSRIP